MELSLREKVFHEDKPTEAEQLPVSKPLPDAELLATGTELLPGDKLLDP